MKSNNLSRRFMPLFVLAALVGGSFGAMQTLAETSVGLPWAHVAQNTSGALPEQFEKVTPLYNEYAQSHASMNYCTDLRTFADPEHHTVLGGVTAEALMEDDVRGGIAEWSFNDEIAMSLFDQVAKVSRTANETEGFVPQQLCGNGNDMMIVGQTTYTDILAYTIAPDYYEAEEKYMVKMQPVNTAMDGWRMYYSDMIGMPVLVTSYGDIGAQVWDMYVVDVAAASMDKVEDCVGYAHLEDENLPDEYRCEREYVPAI